LVVVPRSKLSKDKIIPDRKSLAAILFGLKAQGKVIVLTNGVYDLLHVGHVRCLEDARSRGDFLVVAVNSDDSTERGKGKGHPVVPAKERMEVLAGRGFSLSDSRAAIEMVHAIRNAPIVGLDPGSHPLAAGASR
jgi:cytidyltransferase-like protein